MKELKMRYEVLKKEKSDKQNEMNKNEGQIELLTKQLYDNFHCSNLAEALELVKKLESDIQELYTTIENTIRNVEEELANK